MWRFGVFIATSLQHIENCVNSIGRDPTFMSIMRVYESMCLGVRALELESD